MDGGGHDEVVLDGAGSRPGTREPRTARHALQWVSWIFGFAVLAAVIIAVLHFSEERELVRITENAQPWWLAIAILLQVGTYLAQGETWRVVTRAGKFSVPLSAAFKLSLAKLFIDQALPSAGISGTVVVARALEERGVSRAVVMAAVVVDSVSYYAAYVLTLALALLITVLGGHASPLTVAAALFFVVFSVVLTAAALVLSGRRSVGPKWLKHVPLLKGGLGTFEAASVVTLKLAGVPVAVALAATLLFRGLSFWFPMVPGLVFSRAARKAT